MRINIQQSINSLETKEKERQRKNLKKLSLYEKEI